MPKTDILRAITLAARSLARRKGISFAEAHAAILKGSPEIYEAYLEERASAGAAGSGRAARYLARVQGLTDWNRPATRV